MAEKLKKKISHKKKNKINASLRPIKRNSSNENFKKMKRMEKSQEYLGDKPFNLFFEIYNIFIFFFEKKNTPDVFEIKVLKRYLIILNAIL